MTGLKPGDEVFGYIPLRGGAFAEYAVAKPNELTLKPRSLDYVQAAAVPLTALTAWQSLFDVAQLQSGERLLIHGAGGAVGSFGSQFAKENGAYVLGTASAEKAAIVQETGVDQYINYQEERFEDVASDVEVVLIPARSEDLVTRSYGVMKPGGRLVASSLRPSEEEQPLARTCGKTMVSFLAKLWFKLHKETHEAPPSWWGFVFSVKRDMLVIAQCS